MMPRFHLCGDRSLLVYLGEQIDPDLNRAVHALTRALRRHAHPAIVEVSPSYHCLLVEFDPVRIRPDQVEEMVRRDLAALDLGEEENRVVEVPVLYGGEVGPDLDAVARHTGLTPEEVIQRHSAGLYRVYCLGFSPGFAYMGGLEPALHTPRLPDPRTKVPGGSVAIGGAQTGVYPSPSPGGWLLIGRSPLTMFSPWQSPPSRLNPGDDVRFVPVTAKRYAELEAAEVRTSPEPPAFQPGRSGLRVLQPGLQTTIQDLGRRGYMSLGVPVAGAADFVSLMIGNWLVGNRARTGALEITLLGPEIEFTGVVAFSLTGAPIPAELIRANGGSPRPVPAWTALAAFPGDRLRLGTAQQGCRSYLCVAGGVAVEPVLGSVSEDLFGKIGPLGRPLKTGDWLPVGLPLHPPAELTGRSLPADAIPSFAEIPVIRANRGPQSDAFAPEGFDAFFSGEYLVQNQSDRQGVRLSGPPIARAKGADIISEPIPPGSIQVPANGQPILLLSNRQTTGGYTKIATAIYSDLAVAAQVRPGSSLRFQEVDDAEAHHIAWAERRRLAQIRRYLEREMFRHESPWIPHQEPGVAVSPTGTEAGPAEGTEAEAAEAAEAVGQVRTFRITIGDVTYTAEVEEVEEGTE